MAPQTITNQRPQPMFFNAEAKAEKQESAFEKRERELEQMSKEERQALNAEMFEYFYS